MGKEKREGDVVYDGTEGKCGGCTEGRRSVEHGTVSNHCWCGEDREK